uniref:Snake toxin/toxin-like domain-containing protein n=1 Tax=Trichobilharzia regenti TaxID=157069 RepID=A0AA85JNI1_TRIRE|nr:unnamed protein product [Trichobilharzia regenti]
MKILGIFLIAAVLLDGIHSVKNKKVKCYRCADCPNPFDKELVTELANCNYCRTVYTYRDEDTYRIEKDCVTSCIARDRRNNNVGLVTECCDEDYCNSSPKHISTSYMIILSAALTIYTANKIF